MVNVDSGTSRRFAATALRRRRRELELSQAALAARIGRRRLAVNRWESRRSTPPASVVPLIASALDVSEDYLYEDVVSAD